MSSFINKNKIYFALIVLFVALCAAQVILYPKGSLVIALNNLYNPSVNTFFKYYTHIGDGATFVVVSLIIVLFVKIRWGIISLLTFGVSGGISQLLKKLVFGALPRPHGYFNGTHALNTIEGVDIAYLYSFPSGHSISTFAMFSLLAFMGHKKPWIVMVCFCMAVLSGLSRIYLAQHFTEDVMAGTIIGFASALFLYYWLEEKRPKFINSPALDRPLLKLSA